jgi:hypothetical protein
MAKIDKLTINAQLTGMKNMKTTGGWRLELDLFEQDEVGIMSMTSLVNRQAVVKITLEPVET